MADKQIKSGRSAGSDHMNSLMRRQLGLLPDEQEAIPAEAEPPAPDPAEGDGAKAHKDMNAMMREMFGRND